MVFALQKRSTSPANCGYADCRPTFVTCRLIFVYVTSQLWICALQAQSPELLCVILIFVVLLAGTPCAHCDMSFVSFARPLPRVDLLIAGPPEL